MELLSRIFHNIVDAFFGSVRRIQASACIALGLYIYFNPGVLRGFLLALQRELWPVAEGFLQLAIIVGLGVFCFRRAIRSGRR